MYRVLYPTYRFNIEIKDLPPPPEIIEGSISTVPYTESFKKTQLYDSYAGKSGIDELWAKIRKALDDAGIEAEVRISSFTFE